jgi:prepilin-type N-terminal cleavage/methylation domain-containing protein
MRRGFTLIEVIIALLILEVAMVGVVGAFVLASSTLTRAEVVELQTAAAEGVLDSLARAGAPGADSMRSATGGIAWSVDDSGSVTLRATDPHGSVVLDLRSVMPPW